MSEIKQNTPEWIEARKGIITASRAAACLGLDPHCSARKAWRQITGIEPEDPDNPFMRYGRENEARAIGEYSKLTGNVVEPGGFFPHPTLWWLAASPDGLIGKDSAVECKCPGSLKDRPPITHIVQIKLQLSCTGREWCELFHYLRTGEHEYEFRLWRVGRGGIDGLLAKLESWYMTHVIGNVEPGRKKPKKRRKKEVAEPRAEMAGHAVNECFDDNEGHEQQYDFQEDH